MAGVAELKDRDEQMEQAGLPCSVGRQDVDVRTAVEGAGGIEQRHAGRQIPENQGHGSVDGGTAVVQEEIQLEEVVPSGMIGV